MSNRDNDSLFFYKSSARKSLHFFPDILSWGILPLPNYYILWMITTYPYQSRSVLKITTCRKTGNMIGNNPSTNGEEIPLNSSKATWKDIVVTGTKVKVNNKEKSWIPVTKTKTTTGVENNKEITIINFKNPFWLSEKLISPNWHACTYLLLDMTGSGDCIVFMTSSGRNICPEVVIYNSKVWSFHAFFC